MYSLYRAKDITRKAYNDVINSIKLWNRRDITFMISKITKKSDPHSLLLNLADKINLKRRDKYVTLLNLSINYTQKNMKMPYKNNKFKTSAPTWNEDFELPDGSYSV